MKLRDYQLEATGAVEAAWADGLRAPAVVLPTGMGKTVIFAQLAISRAPEGAVLILVHRDELVTQTVAKLQAIGGEDGSIGVVKAERNETDRLIIVASVQTLSRDHRLMQFTPTHFGTIIVDECHHAAAETYRRILDWFHSAKVVGFTATMSREDTLSLAAVWDKVVYTKDIVYGIANGFLVDVRGRQVKVDGLDLSSVRTSRGDFMKDSLARALDSAGTGRAVADAYVEYAKDRQGILFAPTKALARSMALDLSEQYVTAFAITDDTSIEDRRLAYKQYRAGEIQVLTSVGVLTEGFDMPQAEVAVIARPTKSRALYVQMIGRVLRPWPGKADALVLDVTGASGRHRLAGLIDLAPESSIRTVQDGQSLGEAVAERAAPQWELATQDAEVDLFASSKAAWLQTKGGVWFIPTKATTYFLWPADEYGERYAIGHTEPSRMKGGWLRKDVPLEYAMAIAEDVAMADDHTVADRMRPWRTKPAKPTQAQLGQAARLRINPTGMSKAQLSDAISIEYASRLLDRE